MTVGKSQIWRIFKRMIREIIIKHLKKYPKSEITDIVKLAYQNEFGGGHLIADEKASLEWIKKELSSVKFDPQAQLMHSDENIKKLAIAGSESLLRLWTKDNSMK